MNPPQDSTHYTFQAEAWSDWLKYCSIANVRKNGKNDSADLLEKNILNLFYCHLEAFYRKIYKGRCAKSSSRELLRQLYSGHDGNVSKENWDAQLISHFDLYFDREDRDASKVKPKKLFYRDQLGQGLSLEHVVSRICSADKGCMKEILREEISELPGLMYDKKSKQLRQIDNVLLQSETSSDDDAKNEPDALDQVVRKELIEPTMTTIEQGYSDTEEALTQLLPQMLASLPLKEVDYFLFVANVYYRLSLDDEALTSLLGMKKSACYQHLTCIGFTLKKNLQKVMEKIGYQSLKGMGEDEGLLSRMLARALENQIHSKPLKSYLLKNTKKAMV